LRGTRIKLLPLASDAIVIARIVCDFDPGIVTEPFKRDFPVISLIMSDILTERLSFVL
jgi:hypothetical protein